MKALIPILISLLVVGCRESPTVEIADPIVEKAIRSGYSLNKPTGKLTKADMEKVTKLNLDRNQLTDVKDLENLPQLKFLSLKFNRLTDVKGLEKLTQLTHLYLVRNRLTSVKGLEKLTKLKRLELSQNQLTDLKGLEKLTQLEYLDIAANPEFAQAQINELYKTLPNCRISSNQRPSNVTTPEIVTTPSDTKEPPFHVGKELKPEDVIGSYEAGFGDITFRFVLLENGVVENYFNGMKEPEDAKWKIQGAEVHIEKGKPDGTIIVNKIEPNGDLTMFVRIRNGKREDFQNRTYKKIKSENEPPSKGEDKTSPSIVLEAKAPDTLAAQLVALSPGINEIEVEHDGRSRRLIITAPKTFSRQNLYPILFCFHGAGGKADGPSKRWSPHTDKRDLIVISAEAVQPLAKWNFRDKFHAEEHDDVGFILKVVETLVGSRLADPKTIYATGHSSGGLFCYRLAKEVAVFAALSPMSCGMVKGAHDPDEKTKFVPILQVIGDQDKSFNGSSNPKVTMYSAAKRIDVWRKFNRCGPNPVVIEKGKEIMVYMYASQSGIEVVLCKVKDQGHIIRRDLRDIADSVALDFLLKHKNTK